MLAGSLRPAPVQMGTLPEQAHTTLLASDWFSNRKTYLQSINMKTLPEAGHDFLLPSLGQHLYTHVQTGGC